MEDFSAQGPQLKRNLGVVDLTSLGIAAVVGAGIFSTIGNAAYQGGPAVSVLFIVTAIACAFAALCYAEFASSVPGAGSAYTYAYVSFGEILAWIIGWDLLMEYAIGNIAVAISWSDYFTALLEGYGLRIPTYLTMDFLSASRGYEAVQGVLSNGVPLPEVAAHGVSSMQLEGYGAWLSAPRVLDFPLVCDLPALLITVLITAVVYVGIQESKRVSNIMVAIKLSVVALVIVLGSFYVKPENWSPFAPNGISGVLKGVSGVFFAYIGFDAISTTAEECVHPQRDLPRAMIYALGICTLLYVLVALVITGVVEYTHLQVGDPLAYVFGPEGANLPWISSVVAVSAVIALATVLLVFQLGQPRIWMAMSRDGLLPSIFSRVHPRFRTPWFSTLVTGAFVAIPSLFMNLTEVTDLTSIGTLFAFVLVCAGALRGFPKNAPPSRFKTPYIDGRYLFPVILLGVLGAVVWSHPQESLEFFNWTRPWEVIQHRVPLVVYLVAMAYLVGLCFRNRLSLIPALGVATCGYLMTELGILNWIRFGAWLLLGLVVYFFYGARNSVLRRRSA